MRMSNLRIMLTNVVGLMLPPTDWKKIKVILAPDSGDLATSDKFFNLFCLEPLTHTILDKGYCGLEWIGLSDQGELDCELDKETYKTVRLRFHWLPNCIADTLGQHHLHQRTARKGDTGRLLKFDDRSNHYAMATAIHEHLTNTSKISSHGVTLTRNDDFRPLVSEHIVLIRVREEDLDKTRLMIQLQWLALRMVAISGAAEVVDDLDSEPPNPDELPTYCKLPDWIYDDLEASPAPMDEAELEAALSPTLHNDDPPADDAQRPKD